MTRKQVNTTSAHYILHWIMEHTSRNAFTRTCLASLGGWGSCYIRMNYTEHMQWHSAVATKYKISTHTLLCQLNISCHIPGVHGAFNRTTLLTRYSVCPVLDWWKNHQNEIPKSFTFGSAIICSCMQSICLVAKLFYPSATIISRRLVIFLFL